MGEKKEGGNKLLVSKTYGAGSYRRFIRVISMVPLLFVFWPVIKLYYYTTVFDFSAPLVMVCSLRYRPKERVISLASFKWGVAGIFVLGVAGLVSFMSSYDPFDHLFKVSRILAELSIMVGFVYILASRNIFSITELLFLLCLSASVNSIVCILQGHFGLFISLIPNAHTGVEAWTRMTGFADHPIEAGYISVFGSMISLGLGLHTKKWIRFLPLFILNAYSLTLSASLTAFFAFILGGGLLLFYSKKYKLLIVCLMLGVVLGGVAFSSGMLGRLNSRLEVLFNGDGGYQTLEAREMQWNKAFEKIDTKTFFIGHGFAFSDLLLGAEIHNGIIAALYYFGVLGLIGQIILLIFLFPRFDVDMARPLKGIFLACFLTFMCAHMTGPSLSRRTLWFPVIVLAGYIQNDKKVKGQYLFDRKKPA